MQAHNVDNVAHNTHQMNASVYVRHSTPPHHHPYRRTRMCRHGAGCRKRDCDFAHDRGELRAAPQKPTTIVIDGLNVCHSARHAPHARPLVRVIRHYHSLGHKVLAILPEWAYSGGRDQTRAVAEQELLAPYVARGTVSLAPSYIDDDVFLLKYAQERPGVRVVTNDNYENHVRSGFLAERWRHHRLIKYMWVDGAFAAAD